MALSFLLAIWWESVRLMLLAVAYINLSPVCCFSAAPVQSLVQRTQSTQSTTLPGDNLKLALVLCSSVHPPVHLSVGSVCSICSVCWLFCTRVLYLSPAASTAGRDKPGFPVNRSCVLGLNLTSLWGAHVVTSSTRSPRRTPVCTTSFLRTTEGRTRLRWIWLIKVYTPLQ